ncbi:MAG TPA: type III pantothenate kinase, partial [bacterium]|nr:type III pantothenate kinase [bacterium]
MQLIIDVGNTNITSAIFKNTDIIFDFRLATDKNKSIDEYYISFNTILNSANINISEITDIVICSVVPQLDKILELSFIKYFSIKPFFINLADNLKLNIKINVHNPLEVGADRIANAEYCAVNFKEQNIIVIDFGTATTFDIILKSGIYEGGIIAPGIALSSKALFNAAAKLYPVNYEKIPNNII